tara:strand:+ start:2533 stop:2667 length:135 start_codon:yes stop_codon:yes gene_type:complete
MKKYYKHYQLSEQSADLINFGNSWGILELISRISSMDAFVSVFV